MNTKKLSTLEKEKPEQDLELEILTRKFISGELKLDEYKRKIENIEMDTRLDLRRIATKLKPILIPAKSQK